MGMQARGAPWPQAALCACAVAAGVSHGAGWWGLTWVYDITVNGATFQLGPEFPLGLLAAALMGATASIVAPGAASRFAPTALATGGGLIFASALWILLLWAPAGAPEGQFELLRDLARMGFALLAIGLPLALPAQVPPWARGTAAAAGLALGPIVLFPHHVEAAGLTDVQTTLPMLLFFVQAGVALGGTGALATGKALASRRKPRPEAEPEVSFLAALAPGRTRRARRPPRPPGIRHEPMRHGPAAPPGPPAPAPPAPRARKPDWWMQF